MRHNPTTGKPTLQENLIQTGETMKGGNNIDCTQMMVEGTDTLRARMSGGITGRDIRQDVWQL